MYMWSHVVFQSHSHVRLWDPMDCSTPGFPVPHHLPEVCLGSCPLHRWCHPAISSFDDLFSYTQSFPASRTFPMSRLLASDDQSTGASASASVLPTSIQGWFPLRLTGLNSLLSKGLSGVFPSNTVQGHIIWRSAFFTVQLSQPSATTVKTTWTFLSRVMSLLFNTMSRFVITFLPRSNCLLISWLGLPGTWH